MALSLRHKSQIIIRLTSQETESRTSHNEIPNFSEHVAIGTYWSRRIPRNVDSAQFLRVVEISLGPLVGRSRPSHRR